MSAIYYFVLPTVVIIALYLLLQRKKSHSGVEQWREAMQAGLIEPASLHPVIDPAKCLGCGVCVDACPEGKILGLVNRKAKLVSPSSCIGHGACREACPTNAITLVFGTDTRGVEIPLVSANFETNVSGIFIAGELGGMGLIKNAIRQGVQAVDAVAGFVKTTSSQTYQLVIVGAGPAGLSAALQAKAKGLRYVVLEQDSIGGTMAHYPRGKVVMTQPAKLPLAGEFQFREASKEALIKFWSGVVASQKLSIKTGCKLDDIERLESGFKIHTNQGRLTTDTVLLAMGRRGTPRTLDVEGEELPKVVYKLIDPEQYRDKHVLVVGGGDSALEAACSIAEQPGAQVTISYRSESFSRAKVKNQEKIKTAKEAGILTVELKSTVIKITDEKIFLTTASGEKTYLNDAVIVCAGGILPTPFLKKIGIAVEEKFGTA